MMPDFFQPRFLALFRRSWAFVRFRQAICKAAGSCRNQTVFGCWLLVIGKIWFRVILSWDLKRKAFLIFWFEARIMVAIMENFQEKDGTVKVPKVLVPYMGGKKVISND